MSGNATRAQCIVRVPRIGKADSRLDSASGNSLSIISPAIRPFNRRAGLRPADLPVLLEQGRGRGGTRAHGPPRAGPRVSPRAAIRLAHAIQSPRVAPGWGVNGIARFTEVKVTYRAARWVTRFRRIPTPSSSTSTTSPATMRFVVPGVPV